MVSNLVEFDSGFGMFVYRYITGADQIVILMEWWDDASCRSQGRRLACRRFYLERLSLRIVLLILFPTAFLVLAATDANSFKHLIFVMFCDSETAEWSCWYTTEPFEPARLEILSV
ncbi:hypothetical protein V6N13_078760 [Hibiscus sabdariffa]